MTAKKYLTRYLSPPSIPPLRDAPKSKKHPPPAPSPSPHGVAESLVFPASPNIKKGLSFPGGLLVPS